MISLMVCLLWFNAFVSALAAFCLSMLISSAFRKTTIHLRIGCYFMAVGLMMLGMSPLIDGIPVNSTVWFGLCGAITLKVAISYAAIILVTLYYAENGGRFVSLEMAKVT